MEFHTRTIRYGVLIENERYLHRSAAPCFFGVWYNIPNVHREGNEEENMQKTREETTRPFRVAGMDFIA